MNLLLVGIAGIILFVCAKFVTSPAATVVGFSSLPQYAQTAMNDALSSSITAILDGSSASFSLSQVASGSDYVGVLLTNGSTQIYLTYYEYLNWFQTAGATLTVPARSLSNGVITPNAWGGYSVNIDTSVYNITSTRATTKAGITYRDSSNAIKSITTSFLSMRQTAPQTPTTPPPSITTGTTQIYPPGTQASLDGSQGEFVAKTSLDTISLYLVNRKPITAFTYTYSDAGQNTVLTLSQLSLSGALCGYVLTSADAQTNIYLTYAEGYNLAQNGSITIPYRKSGGAIVGNFLSSGYILSLSGTAVTVTPYAEFINLPTIVSANVLDIYNKGNWYEFYPTYNMLGIGANMVDSFLTNTQNATYTYTSAGLGVSVTAIDLVQNNKRCGLKLTYTSASITYVVHIPYLYIVNWIAANTSAQIAQQTANASLVLWAYAPANVTAADGTGTSILQPTAGSFTLQFDSSSPKKITIIFSLFGPPAGYATITYARAGGQVTVNAYTGT